MSIFISVHEWRAETPRYAKEMFFAANKCIKCNKNVKIFLFCIYSSFATFLILLILSDAETEVNECTQHLE